MPIDYVCPFCHAKYFVDDAYRGQTGPCAECGKNITIPGRASSGYSEVEAEARLVALEARSRRARWLRVGVMAFIVVVAFSVLYLLTIVVVPEVQKIATRRGHAQSLSNLQKIAKALNDYASEYGTYPPPFVSDSTGTPLYSWRVLILPQLGYRSLYERFKLEENWGSTDNMTLVDMMPAEYEPQGLGSIYFDGETAVSLIVGPGTLFPATGPLSPEDVTDLPESTILVTESSRNVNTWTAPFDCNYTPATGIGSTLNTDIGAQRAEAVAAVAVDETFLLIPNTTTSSKLRALITPKGNEALPVDEFAPQNFGLQLQ